MRNPFRLSTLAAVAMAVVVGCSSTAAPTAIPTAVPPAATAVPPAATAVPPAPTAVPPAATAVPPAPTAVPPAPTAVPPAPTAAPTAAPTPFSAGVDDGTHITMWSRAATQVRAQALVDAYNASHKNQVDMTVVPTDDYQTKVGSAAAANGLPDLFSADVVFMPNWTSAGLFQDLTAKIKSLPYADKITQAHIVASTWEGKQYGLPFVMDLSVWMYNKKLFTQAGLDPNKAPTTLAEFAADARAVAKLGGSIHGTAFGGNCGGCEVFTWWPTAWADGEKVMSDDGMTSFLNSAENKSIYAIIKAMVDDGTVLLPDSKTETGPTWTAGFGKGTIGIQPMPASLQGLANDSLADADIGVAAIGGVTGGQSTFVGGDSIGLSKDAKNVEQAWNFLAWLEGDDAQINVVAKGGNVVSRTDLASNQYTAADPRVLLMNQIAAKGQTPFALRFGQTFNDAQGPWLILTRDAVFGDPTKVDADNDAINTSLQSQ
jgi:multiple sugar transport system substrate-binding protein